MQEDVFTHTSIQHLDLPSVTHIENCVFGGSKLRTLKVENCQIIEEKAFVNQYDTIELKFKVKCGCLNLDNVKNCTKVDRIICDEQKIH